MSTVPENEIAGGKLTPRERKRIGVTVDCCIDERDCIKRETNCQEML